MKWFAALMSCVFVALTGLAQSTAPAPLGLVLQASYRGYLLPEGAYVPAPADILIHPEIETTMAVRAGDAVSIDFIADGKTLSSAKAVWHDAGKFSPPGSLQPLILSRAQFLVPNCVWTNLSQGSHTISLRAYHFHGLTASAGPMHFTVIPPLPHQPPRGTHTLTGKQRPPIGPGQVAVFRQAPRGTFEVVGTVTARAVILSPRDSQGALAELRTQAGLMGANCVVIDQASHTGGQPFGGPAGTFKLPQIFLSGRAIYVPPATQ